MNTTLATMAAPDLTNTVWYARYFMSSLLCLILQHLPDACIATQKYCVHFQLLLPNYVHFSSTKYSNYKG